MRTVAFRHTRPGRLGRPRGTMTSTAHDRGSQDPYHSPFYFQPLSSKRRSRSFQVQAQTNPTHHHGRPLYFILNEDSYFSSFFGCFLVSVRLPLFAYMSLNYVAILYKSLHVSASKYHPVLFYPICVLLQPFKLFAPLLARSLSLSSTFAPLFLVHCRPS